MDAEQEKQKEKKCYYFKTKHKKISRERTRRKGQKEGERTREKLEERDDCCCLYSTLEKMGKNVIVVSLQIGEKTFWWDQ